VFKQRWIRIAFVVIAVLLLTVSVVKEWKQIGPRLERVTASTLVLGMVCVIAGLIATMMAWRALLRDLGSRLAVRPVARIFFIGQLGKYIPGSVWPVVMQMELGVKFHVPRARSAAASLVQMALSVGTGALVAVLALPLTAGHATTDLPWMVVVVVVCAVALSPRIANPALAKGFRLLKREPLERPLSWRGLGLGTGWLMAAWVLFGIPIALLARALGGSGWQTLTVSVGGFALSWVVGFLVVIAPAGAGVREAIMIALLSTVISPASALAVALISRLMLTVGDLVLGLVTIAVTRSTVSPNPTSGPRTTPNPTLPA